MNRRVKMIRAYFDLTGREFASRIGVGPDLVSRWERGVTPVALVYVHAIIGATGVSREWLETGFGAMFHKEEE